MLERHYFAAVVARIAWFSSITVAQNTGSTIGRAEALVGLGYRTDPGTDGPGWNSRLTRRAKLAGNYRRIQCHCSTYEG
jgi:hypothetical protein